MALSLVLKECAIHVKLDMKNVHCTFLGQFEKPRLSFEELYYIFLNVTYRTVIVN